MDALWAPTKDARSLNFADLTPDPQEYQPWTRPDGQEHSLGWRVARIADPRTRIRAQARTGTRKSVTHRKRSTLTVNDQDPYSASSTDSDPEETAEWNESLDQLVAAHGHGRAREIMLSLLKRSKELHLGVPMVPTTDYINTIAPENEAEFPGDEALERKYRAWIRWNAAITVHRAQRPGVGVGGHISTYASSAALYEVGHNHFFRGQSHAGGGDQIFYQGHASPGMYARAFLEGRLSTEQLEGFRQE